MTIAPSSSNLAKLNLLAAILAPKEAPAGATPATTEKVGKLWRITVIKAGRALTGDEYPPEVLRASLDIFKGLPIYSFRFGDDAADTDPDAGFHHLPEDATGDPRGQPTGNMIGQVTDEVWWNEEEQSIQAFAAIDDTKVRDRLKNAHARGAIGEGVEAPVFGFSIFAEVLKQESRVAKFVKGNSLDLVTRPAAGGAFEDIVAEAPMAVPFVTTLRAETSLEEQAILRIVLEEVSRRVDRIVYDYDDETTIDQKKAALAALAQEIIGTMGDGGAAGDPIAAAVSQRLEEAREAIEQESDMDAATITKLVAEQVKAGLDKAKADADAEANAARAADPISTLQTWLESLQGEERMSALQQVQAMLAALGAAIEEGAGAGMTQDEFAALTAELQGVTEEKDSKAMRARLTKVVESIVTPAEVSPELAELTKLREEMRDQALAFELDKLGPELGLHNPAAVMVMADLSGVTVKGTAVEGLKEAIELVVKDNPWVAGKVKAEDPKGDGATGDGATGATGDGDPGTIGKGGATGDDPAKAKAELEAAKAEADAEAEKAKVAAEAAATKANELAALSAATIRESVTAGGIGALTDGQRATLKDLQVRIARGGDLKAALQYKRMRASLMGAGA